MTLRGAYRPRSGVGPGAVRVDESATPRNDWRGPPGPGVPCTPVAQGTFSAHSESSSSSSLDHPDHPDQSNGDKGFRGPGCSTKPGPTRTMEPAGAGEGSGGNAGRRVIGRPWKPGQSGNPSGMPKDIAPLVLEARRLALSYAPRAIERLAELVGSKDERVAVAAAEGLLDRAGLRPYALEPERHEVAVAAVDVDALRATLAARVAGLAQLSGRPPESGARAALPAGASDGAPLDGSGAGVGQKSGVP